MSTSGSGICTSWNPSTSPVLAYKACLQVTYFPECSIVCTEITRRQLGHLKCIWLAVHESFGETQLAGSHHVAKLSRGGNRIPVLSGYRPILSRLLGGNIKALEDHPVDYSDLSPTSKYKFQSTDKCRRHLTGWCHSTADSWLTTIFHSHIYHLSVHNFIWWSCKCNEQLTRAQSICRE